MKQGILIRTNILVCLIIIGGFAVTSVLSYQANYGASLQNIEQVSRLASDSIYYRLTTELSEPVNVSLTMANDSLLKSFLSEEDQMESAGYIDTIREYLGAYRDQHDYDSVFLISTASGRYYNFEGLDRMLAPDNPENDWYYALLESDDDWAMNVDNDEAADNEVTVFVNCKIYAEDGSVLGIVGVGLRIGYLQALFEEYREEFLVDTYLVGADGVVEVSSEHNGHEGIDYFSTRSFTEDQRRSVLEWGSELDTLDFWAGQGEPDGSVESDFVVSRYLSDPGWHLVVERDTGVLVSELRDQMTRTVLVIILVLAVILLVITSVIRNFNRKIMDLARSVESERRSAFQKATEQLFDDIYELDVTNDRPANRAAEEYFESLGAPRGASYTRSLHIVAEKQIKEEFRQGYLETFLPKNVLAAYESGRDELRYEFMISTGGEYYWLRITACIVKNDVDGSIHMLTYRQNIDAEKRREDHMRQLTMTDEMTDLLTKVATERLIGHRLEEAPERLHAFFIFDIDVFKEANDLFGHAFGDTVIKSFAETIRTSFRADDIIGRVGGDEFVAFVPVPSESWAKRKAEVLSRALDRDHEWDGKVWHVSSSIGIALAPRDGCDFETLYRHADEALYRTKERGRKGYTLYGEE